MQLMKSIYSQAHIVHCWIGEATAGSDDATRLLRNIMKYDDPDHLFGRGTYQALQRTNMLFQLLYRPWWQRVWIQQELGLAKRARLHCGLTSIGLTAAVNARADYRFNKIMGRLQKEIPDFTLHLPEHRQAHCLDVMDRLYTLRITHERRKVRSPETNIVDFMASLGQVRYLQTSDPLDSVFGFLGLAPGEVTNLIKPDYELSAIKVYENATVHLIRVSESLWPFGLTGRMASSQFVTPSWVVDWSYLAPEDHFEWTYHLWLADRQGLFRACGTQLLSYDHIETGVIRLLGESLGRVKETLPRDRKVDPEEIWLRRVYGKFAAEGQEPHSPRYVTGGCRLNALWKTLVYDMEWKSDKNDFIRCSNEETSHFQQWFSNLPKSASSGSSDPLTSRTGIFRILDYHRTLFTTDDGYIGMGPAELKQGDRLFILAGGHMVYALRPADRLDYFTLVGDCYVHGVMDGELSTCIC